METALPQTDTTATRRLIVVVGGLGLGAAMAGILSSIGVNEAIRNVVVPGIPGLLAAADEALIYRRNSRPDRLKASLRVGMTQRALPLALTAVLALLFFERLVLLLIGASGAVTVWLANSDISALNGYAIALEFGAFFVVLPMGLGMLFIGRYMSHRVASHQYEWAAGVALAVVSSDIAILAILVDVYNLSWHARSVVVVYVTMAILLLAGGLAGTKWGLWEDRSYVMKRLFSRLGRDEQDTVIELVTPTTD
jgi:hypothetical protein